MAEVTRVEFEANAAQWIEQALAQPDAINDPIIVVDENGPLLALIPLESFLRMQKLFNRPPPKPVPAPHVRRTT